MNDLELLQRFRDDVPDPSPHAWERARAALTAAQQEALLDADPSFETVRSHRRRQLRLNRWAAGLGVGGVAAAITLTLALTGVLGSVRPTQSTGTTAPTQSGGTTAPTESDGTTAPTESDGTVQTVGFVLTANSNGTLTLTMTQILDAIALQQALEQHGIPALVKANSYCTSNPAAPDPTSIGVLSANPPFSPKPGVGLIPASPQPIHPKALEHSIANTQIVINPAEMPAGTELAFGYTPGDSLIWADLIYTNSYTCTSQPPPPGPTSS